MPQESSRLLHKRISWPRQILETPWYAVVSLGPKRLRDSVRPSVEALSATKSQTFEYWWSIPYFRYLLANPLAWSSYFTQNFRNWQLFGFELLYIFTFKVYSSVFPSSVSVDGHHMLTRDGTFHSGPVIYRNKRGTFPHSSIAQLMHLEIYQCG